MGSIISYIGRNIDDRIDDFKRESNLRYLNGVKETNISKRLYSVLIKMIESYRQPTIEDSNTNNRSCTSCTTDIGFFTRKECTSCNHDYCGNCIVNQGLFETTNCRECKIMNDYDFRPFKNNFEYIRKITPLDIQPIPINEGAKSFRSGTYFMIKTKGNFENGHDYFPIHRIIDDNSHRGGCFWTPMVPSGGDMLQERIDLAVLPRWNKMTQSVYDSLPPGIIIYGGYAAPQSDNTHSYLGGGLQFYIPKEIASIIFNKEGNIINIILEVYKKQDEMMKEYIDAILQDWNDKIANSKNLIYKTGNKTSHLPYALKRLLDNPNEGVPSFWGSFSDGVYDLHEEEDEFLGITIKITITVRHVKTTSITQGNTKYITRHYEIKINIETIYHK
jgi:hypothetical protein